MENGHNKEKLKSTYHDPLVSEKTLDFILNSSNTAYWEIKFPDMQEYVSPAIIHTLGYTEEEWTDLDLDLNSSLDNENYFLASRALSIHINSRGKIPYDLNLKFHHKKGHFIKFRSKGEITKWNMSNQPVIMRGTLTRVSEKMVHSEVEDYYERLSLIVEGINAGIWDWDISNETHWWSPRFYNLLKYKEGEIEAGCKSFCEILHPVDLQVFKNTYRDHIYLDHPFKIEVRILNKDANYEWFEIAGRAKKDSKGEAIRMVGSIINIQDRKSIEEEVMKSQFLLAEAGKIAKAGAWELDVRMQLFSWSEEVFYIHDLEKGTEPSLEESLAYYPGKYRKIVEEAYKRAIEEGKAFDLECKFITARNNHIWVRLAGYPAHNHWGEVIAVRGIIQDINELKNKEIELQKSLDVLAYQNKRLQNFAHIVSHNLRSHTGNIKMLLNFYERSDDEESKAEVLNNIYKVSDQLDKTIYHLNEIVEEKVDLDKDLKLLNFEEVLLQTLEVLEGSIRDQNVKIHYDFDKAPIVNFIRPYLDSLFLNLLSNAIKYRHKDRDPVINICSYKKNNSIILEIEDNGSGIDLNRHGSKVFGMYKTFHKNSDARGLGLFLTKNQIETTGGTIEISSTPHIGTKFIICFRKQD